MNTNKRIGEYRIRATTLYLSASPREHEWRIFLKEASRMNSASNDRKHWDLCHSIIEVFYAVYNELGHGFLEAVYEEALALALTQAGFAVSRQVATPIWFRGKKIGDYKADLLVNSSVLIELKTVRAIEPAHEAQVLNYLRATDLEVALLLNFGPIPNFKRLVFDNSRKGVRVNSRGMSAL